MEKIIVVLLLIGIVFVSGCTSDNEAANQADDVVQEQQELQEPACDEEVVGAWWLVGNEVYFIVEPDCSISKFCDLINDYHTTGSVSENTIIFDGISTNKFVMNGSSVLIILGGPDGMDLPFARIYREYGIDPIPEDC
ncbi:MAG: hypothetical protein JSV92_01230 [archaeon]|nr:MAG: hypothetical protein JSV92_01230 [archaeon]